MVFAAFLSRRRALTCSFRARHALPHELISCGEASPEAFHFCLSEALGLFGEPLAFQLPRCLSNRSSAVQGKDDRERSDQSFHVNFPSSVLRTAKSFAPAHARRDRLLLALPMGNYNTASTRRTPCSLIALVKSQRFEHRIGFKFSPPSHAQAAACWHPSGHTPKRRETRTSVRCCQRLSPEKASCDVPSTWGGAWRESRDG